MRFTQKVRDLKKMRLEAKDARREMDAMLASGIAAPESKKAYDKQRRFVSLLDEKVQSRAIELKEEKARMDAPRRRAVHHPTDFDPWTLFVKGGRRLLNRKQRSMFCEADAGLAGIDQAMRHPGEDPGEHGPDVFNLDAWEKSEEYAQRNPRKVAARLASRRGQYLMQARRLAGLVRAGGRRFNVGLGDGLATDEADHGEVALAREELMGISQRLQDRSGIYEGCKVTVAEDGGEVERYADTANPTAGSWKASHGQMIAPDPEPNIKELKMQPHPITSNYQAIQRNTLTDIKAFNTAQYTQGRIYEKILLAFNNVHTHRKADGNTAVTVNAPTGLALAVTASGIETSSKGADATVDLDTLNEVIFAIERRYLKAGSDGNPYGYMNDMEMGNIGWMMNQATFAKIHTADNERQNQITIKGNLAEGIPDVIHGYPVVFNDAMHPVGVAGSAQEAVIIFGNFNAYEVVTVGSTLLVKRFDDSFTNQWDQVWFESTFWSNSMPTMGLTNADSQAAAKTEALKSVNLPA